MAFEPEPAETKPVVQGSDDGMIIVHPGESIVNITARTARRIVNQYVGGEISMMMGGREPELVDSGGQPVWRVPIVFISP